MPSVTRVPAPPRRIDGSTVHVVVFPKVKENDSSFKATVRADGMVILSGTASNRSTKPSSLTLTFAGQEVTVRLRSGMPPQEVREALAKALPEGFELHTPAWVGRTGANKTSFQVRTAPKPGSNVVKIDAAFRKARANGVVTRAELQKAVTIALDGGLSTIDKIRLARNWGEVVAPGDAYASPAAQREYTKVQKELGLPGYGML